MSLPNGFLSCPICAAHPQHFVIQAFETATGVVLNDNTHYWAFLCDAEGKKEFEKAFADLSAPTPTPIPKDDSNPPSQVFNKENPTVKAMLSDLQDLSQQKEERNPMESFKERMQRQGIEAAYGAGSTAIAKLINGASSPVIKEYVPNEAAAQAVAEFLDSDIGILFTKAMISLSGRMIPGLGENEKWIRLCDKSGEQVLEAGMDKAVSMLMEPLTKLYNNAISGDNSELQKILASLPETTTTAQTAHASHQEREKVPVEAHAPVNKNTQQFKLDRG